MAQLTHLHLLVFTGAADTITSHDLKNAKKNKKRKHLCEIEKVEEKDSDIKRINYNAVKH